MDISDDTLLKRSKASVSVSSQDTPTLVVPHSEWQAVKLHSMLPAAKRPVTTEVMQGRHCDSATCLRNLGSMIGIVLEELNTNWPQI